MVVDQAPPPSALSVSFFKAKALACSLLTTGEVPSLQHAHQAVLQFNSLETAKIVIGNIIQKHHALTLSASTTSAPVVGQKHSLSPSPPSSTHPTSPPPLIGTAISNAPQDWCLWIAGCRQAAGGWRVPADWDRVCPDNVA